MARLHRVLATLTLLVAATALSAAPALARKRDHDKLPDRWERKFHLNTKKNDAKRDRDRDGLSNYREYRAHTNPRKKDSDRDGLKDGAELRFGFNPRDRDSDNDGTKDGKENAGKITALTGSSITIRLAAGGKLTAGLAIDCSGGDSSGAATPATTRRRTRPTTRRPTTADDDPSADDDDPDDDADGYDLSPPPRRTTPPTTTRQRRGLRRAVRPGVRRRPDVRRELAEARLARPRGDGRPLRAEPGGHRRRSSSAR